MGHQKESIRIDQEADRPIVVLVFAEALSAPEVAWSLVDGDFEVYAIGRRGRGCALRHSRNVKCQDICSPERDMVEALKEMATLIDSIGRSDAKQKLLFPLDDTAVWMCNELNPSDDWTIVGPRHSNAALALDKQLQTEAARKAGFNVPASTVSASKTEVVEFSNKVGFPIILKSVECVPIRNGRKVGCRKWICANREELDAALDAWGEIVPLLAQTYIEGIGEGVFGLATLKGVRAWSAHRRLRMMNPQGSGASACISKAVDSGIKENVESLIDSVGWRGLFMVELLRDRTGKVWFVELNGRPWGSTALARRQGLEYPAWAASLALDGGCVAGANYSVAPGLVCRHFARELMHLLFVLRGPRSAALRAWPSVWRSLREVLRLSRSDRFYNWRRDDAGVFVADCWYTIQHNIVKGR